MRGFTARAIPNAIVFLSGVAIMVVELVASRLVARHIGSSLETWTTVIGVILAGMSLGNYWGGRLSDERDPMRTLPMLLGGAAVLCVSVLVTNDWIGDSSVLAGWPHTARVLVVITLVFLPPACVLGTIQPTVAQWAISRSARAGAAFGNIGAWNTAGNILGTFVTGFILLLYFGIRSIVITSAALLAGTALLTYVLARATQPAASTSRRVREETSRRDEPAPTTDFWERATPNFFVFVTGLSIMMVELVGGRLLSRHCGSSIFTWTSLIGVILAGVSVGNYLGGVLADRFTPRRTLPHLFVMASIMTASVLVTEPLMKLIADGRWSLLHVPIPFTEGGLRLPDAVVNWLTESTDLPLRTFLGVLMILFVPACALGSVSPVVAKLALERAAKSGTAIGNVYAWGAIGSIVGTFATGFFLISALGTKAVLCAVAGLLALISVSMATSGLPHAIWAGILMALAIPLAAPESWSWATRMGDMLGIRETHLDGEYHHESNYYHIKVTDNTNSPYPDSRELVLDNLIHGYVVKGHPRELQYSYELIYASIMERAGAFPSAEHDDGDDAEMHASVPTKSLRTLFIGGGSYTYPRYIEACYPGSKILVAEIDPAVTATAHRQLFLEEDTTVKTRWGDARNTIDELLRRRARGGAAAERHANDPPTQFEFVFGDAFNDFSVPWHLTTREFNEKIKDLLAPGGVYMINIIDNYKYCKFLGAYVQTARQTFGNKNVSVFCVGGSQGRLTEDRETFVISMSRDPLDVAELGSRPGERPRKGVMLTETDVREAIRRCRFDDPAYRRRYLTKEQEAEGIEEATREWNQRRQELGFNLKRLTDDDGAATSNGQKAIAEAARKLQNHHATKRTQLEEDLRRYSMRSGVLSDEQLAKIDRDVESLPAMTLTDDWAPVENLLAPVARDR